MAVNLVSRVQKILMSPKTEWDVIDKEPADIPGTLTTYVAPLIIAAQVATFIGLMLFARTTVYGVTVGPSITGLAINSVLAIVLGVVMVYVFAFIVDALAPSFGAQKNFGQAFKVSAFSGTAAWVGGIFNIIPYVGWILALVGAIYSLYLLFVGLPKLMKPPADKGVIYTLACIAVIIILYIIIAFITARVRAGFMTVG
jgi:hypothetical protein